jgi:hypothetical protein
MTNQKARMIAGILAILVIWVFDRSASAEQGPIA